MSSRRFRRTSSLIGPSTPRRRELRSEINARRALIEAIADATGPEYRQAIARGLDEAYKSAVGACERLAGAIASQQEREEILLPQGPKLAASDFHPWVWEEAASRWDAGFYRDAVQAAATRIFDVELPRKLGVLPSRNPADLFAAFAPDKTTGMVLRFKDIDPADATWASVHRGTMLVGQGCVPAIRNPRTHRLAVSEDQVTLEELATLSLLARWIDDADAVDASAKERRT